MHLLFRFSILILIIFSTSHRNLQSQSKFVDNEIAKSSKSLNAYVIYNDNDINIDGFLNEKAWKYAEVAINFVQRFPEDGGEASQATEAYIVLSEKAVYIGFKAYDNQPNLINKSIFRRDGSDVSDWVYVSIDSYFDRRTAFTFAVNPRGVQKDVLYFDDLNEDLEWDAVWETQTQIEQWGWSAEIRIPLSQLRFDDKKNIHTWGINFQRRIARTNEINFWSPVSQSQSGMVSRYGTLHIDSKISNPKKLELKPYISANQISKPVETDDQSVNPYNKSHENRYNIGADLKYGLTSDLTLTATINPDFGQVEADPATINLSEFETFFEEKRPFFLEGNEIFNFGGTKTFFRYGNPGTFYTRRIGKAPSGSIHQYLNENNKVPESETYQPFSEKKNETPIASAVKISGKTKTGWSIGFLDAFTLKQNSKYTLIDSLGRSETSTFLSEPTTNFLISRIKKDLNGGKTYIGGFLSHVNRDIESNYFDSYLRRSAYVSGADFEHNFKDYEWVVSGTFSYSSINGSQTVINQAQNAPQRYYQRVDSDYLKVNENINSLSGYATELSLQKSGGKNWIGSVTYSEVSPGYETNDLGFMNRADYRALNITLRYKEVNPDHFRFYQIWVHHEQAYNFDIDRISNAYNTGAYIEFDNQWSFNLNLNTQFGRISDRLTRGGPIVKLNDDFNFNFNINSNRSTSIYGGLGQYHRFEKNSKEYDHYYWGYITFLPMSSLRISIEPEVGFEYDIDQFITSKEDTNAPLYNTRYIFSDMSSVNVSTNFFLNWTFTPHMSLQTYVRPFISSRKFSNFKELSKPSNYKFNVYGKDEGFIFKSDDEYLVDPDGSGPANTFSFSYDDFVFRSLQGNLVFRWEYSPGATLFLVWQQLRNATQRDKNMVSLSDDLSQIWDTKPTNIYMIKINYWLNN